jgi:hypothetical protein
MNLEIMVQTKASKVKLNIRKSSNLTIQTTQNVCLRGERKILQNLKKTNKDYKTPIGINLLILYFQFR